MFGDVKMITCSYAVNLKGSSVKQTITRKSQYKQCEMKYQDYIKLLGYLNENCTDKNYHVAMSKLDKFKIIQE